MTEPVITYPNRIWSGTEFVNNPNREMSSNNFTTVAVSRSNEVLGFPDGMSVQEMEHHINGDLYGTISEYKPKFYDRVIREPLSKLGMDMFQPKFITDVKLTGENAFATSFARSATADIIKPMFSDEAAEQFPVQATAGSLAGIVVGMKGVSQLLGLIKLPTFAGYANKVLPNLPKVAQKAIVAGGTSGAIGGTYRGISETANEIRDKDYPEISKIGEAVIHDTLWWGGIGGVTGTVTKPIGVAASTGLGYLMAKVDGAGEEDALFNGAVLGMFHLVASHGEKPRVRKAVVDNTTRMVADYIKVKNPAVDDHVSIQAAKELLSSHADTVLRDTQPNLVRDAKGKPVEINPKTEVKPVINSVEEVLKTKENTQKLIENVANEVLNIKPSDTVAKDIQGNPLETNANPISEVSNESVNKQQAVGSPQETQGTGTEGTQQGQAKAGQEVGVAPEQSLKHEQKKLSKEEIFKKMQQGKADKHLSVKIKLDGNLMTKKEMIDNLKKDGYLFKEVDVYDDLARRKDQEIADRAMKKYIFTKDKAISNGNLPKVKEGMAALQRLDKNEYKKVEYRAKKGNSTYEISKTQYEYSKEVSAKREELKQPQDKEKQPSLNSQENVLKPLSDSIKEEKPFVKLDSGVKDQVIFKIKLGENWKIQRENTPGKKPSYGSMTSSKAIETIKKSLKNFTTTAEGDFLIIKGNRGEISLDWLNPIYEKIEPALSPEGRESAYQKTFNRFQSIENTVDKARALGADIKPGEDAGISADRYLSNTNQAENVLKNGTYRITKEGKIEKTGEGLREILDSQEKEIPKSYEDFVDYAIARRYQDLARPKDNFSGENIATPEQIAEAQKTILDLTTKYGDKIKIFETNAQRLTEYSKRVLENLVDSGILSQEKFLDILEKNPNYIPFDRIMPEETPSGVPVTKNRFSKVANPVRKIKGSDLDIHNPIESIIKNTYRIMDAASRNKVFQDIYKLKDIEGLDIEAIGPDFKAIKVSEKETGTEDITIFRPSQFTPKGNVIEGFVDGKHKYLKVSKNLKEAMTGLNEQSSSLLVKIISKPASWLRTGATITPEFVLRNPIRDQWTAFLQTRVGFRPFLDTAGAIGDIIGKKEIYNDWIRSGGSYSTFVELSRPSLEKMSKELMNNPSMLKRLNIVHTMQEISQLMEQATRIGVYKAALRKGMTAVESARESRESTINFSRRGSGTKDINSVIAFFNAGLQGFDKSIQIVKRDPVGFTAKAVATITIPSLLLYLKNRQDKDYYEIPRWQRDLFWNTKIGDTWWKIPKPFLYGQVFGSLSERFMEYVDTKDKKSFDRLGNSILGALSPVSEEPLTGIIPTAIKPLLENKTNYNFFRDRPIVNYSKERLIPSQQFGKYDTETAKQLGIIFNVSPSKIENLIQGYFGGSGRYALQGGDLLINKIKKLSGKDSPEKKPTELSDIPLVKGFASIEPISGNAESIQNFYKRRDEISKLYNTYVLFKKNSPEKAVQLEKLHPELRESKRYEAVAENITTINKRIDEINKSNILSSKQKKNQVKKLEQNKIDMIKRLKLEEVNNKSKKTSNKLRNISKGE